MNWLGWMMLALLVVGLAWMTVAGFGQAGRGRRDRPWSHTLSNVTVGCLGGGLLVGLVSIFALRSRHQAQAAVDSVALLLIVAGVAAQLVSKLLAYREEGAAVRARQALGLPAARRRLSALTVAALDVAAILGCAVAAGVVVITVGTHTTWSTTTAAMVLVAVESAVLVGGAAAMTAHLLWRARRPARVTGR